MFTATCKGPTRRGFDCSDCKCRCLYFAVETVHTTPQKQDKVRGVDGLELAGRRLMAVSSCQPGFVEICL